MMPEPYARFRDEFIALDPERYPADYIDAQVWAGFWMCLGSNRAAIICEIKTFPSGIKEVHGVAAAGDLREIVDLIPQAEALGRQAGCVRAVIESREGWLKMLPDYEHHQTAIRKEL